METLENKIKKLSDSNDAFQNLNDFVHIMNSLKYYLYGSGLYVPIIPPLYAPFSELTSSSAYVSQRD